MKKKAILSILTAAVLALSFVFSQGALFARADDTDYGEAAYGYLRYLTDHFPNRVNNRAVQESTESKVACGEWINEVMTGLGYTPRIIDGDPNRPENLGNNVRDYCYLKQGRSSKKIVIGAHYDCVETKGTEDNGTGVAVVMELAKRFKDVDTALSLEFFFWDGEEYLCFAGSFAYLYTAIGTGEVNDILLYINLDCVGAGDRLYLFGGEYEGDVLKRDWGLNMTLEVAESLGISVYTAPEEVTNFPTPTRLGSSDHVFFYLNKIPYVYFEATAIVDEEGNIVNPESPYAYHTNDPRVVKTDVSIRGRIIHSVFDDLDKLEELFPGRIKTHMAETSKIVTKILKTANESSPAKYEGKYPSSGTQPAVPPTEAPTEAPTKAPTEAPTTAPTDAPTKAPTDAPTEAPTEHGTKAEESVPEASTGAAESPSEPEKPTETAPESPSETPAGNEDQTREADSGKPSGDDAPLKPVTAAEVIVVVFVLLLWAIWAYVYLKYYR